MALVCACWTFPTNAEPPANPATLEQAISRLGHDEFAIREAASKQLWLVGIRAIPALQKAANGPDAEVRQRARTILEKFELGLTPDMPPEFETLLVNFRQSQLNDKQLILNALIDEKKIKLAFQLARSEKDVAIRDTLVSNASRHAQRFVPEMLARNEIDDAEAILEAVEIAADSSLERLTAVLYITGRLPERLKAAEAKLAAASSPPLVKRLMYFRRANGDLAGAADLAGKNQLAYYQRAILLEKSDWAGAAAVHQGLFPGPKLSAESQAFGAALNFFAGNQAAADGRLLELRTNAVEQLSTYWDAAEAHLACEQPEHATKLLEASIPAAASYIHGLRMNYARSQALGGVTKDTKFDKAWYDALVDGGLVATQMRIPRAHFARNLARQLHHLGERERAKQIVAVLRAEAERDSSGPWWPTLLSADLYLRDRPQALLDLQQALGKPGVAPSSLFGALYPKDFLLADALYVKLTSEAGKKEEALALVEQIFGPAGFSAEEAKSLAEKVAAEIEPWHGLSDYRLHLRAGDICLRLNDRPRARRWFERAASSTTDGNVRLGDLALEDRDWEAAAKWYRAACEKLPSLPLPRHLLGEALIQAGKKDEGEREQRQASLAALAPVTRYQFAFHLKERGLNAAAADQALVLLRTSNPTVQHPTLAAGHLRANVIAKESPEQAADAWQRWLLSMLSGVNNYQLLEHYLADPELIHRIRARALLKAGKPDAAITELRRVQIIMPGNVRMLEDFVPLLKQADRAEIANALLTETISRYEEVIRDYPHTSDHRRDLALLLARCNRRLDEALTLAQAAVKLEETTALNHDALAEIYFLRGEFPQAIQAGERALAMEKDNPEFRTRLAKWRKGSPPR